MTRDASGCLRAGPMRQQDQVFINTASTRCVENRLEHLVRESALRSNLSYFYLAVLVKSNAEQLSRFGLAGEMRGAGNKTSKGGFDGFVEWLCGMRDLARDDDSFEDNMVEPFRISAKFCTKQDRTTDIRGLVITTSERYYDDMYENYRRTVSLVSPDLKAAFSMRVNDEYCVDGEGDELSPGYYLFKSVMPVPFTNRLHPTGPGIVGIDKEDDPREWDFLCSRISDLGHFDHSVSMEHYCEIPIHGGKRRHLLGAVLAVSGRVHEVDGPAMTLKSVTDGATAKFYVQGRMRDRDTAEFKGKVVRALIVNWYVERAVDDAGDMRGMREPWLFDLWEIDEKGAANDDVMGYVRIRGTVSTEELAEVFGKTAFPGVPGMVVDRGTASLETGNNAQDPVCRGFLETADEIRRLRRKSPPKEGPLHTVDDVMDPEKLNIERMARDGHIFNALNRLITLADSGAPEKDMKDTWRSLSRMRRDKLLAIGAVDGDVLKVNHLGVEMVHKIRKDEISGALRGLELVSVVEHESKIPPTLLLRHLKMDGYEKIKYLGHAHDLLWKRQGAGEPRDLELIVSGMHHGIISTMSRYTNPFHPDKIREWLCRGPEDRVISMHSTNCMLRFLEATGRLRRMGDSYELPLDQRILLLLDKEPGTIRTEDQIIRDVLIPMRPTPNQPSGMPDGEKARRVRDMLGRMAEDNTATEVLEGHWRSYCGPDELDGERRAAIMGIMRGRVLAMLERGAVPAEGLVARMDHQSRDLCRGRGWRYNARELVSELLELMVRDGLVHASGGVVRPA